MSRILPQPNLLHRQIPISPMVFSRDSKPLHVHKKGLRSKREIERKVYVYPRWKDRALMRPGRFHKMGCVVQGGDDIIPTGGPGIRRRHDREPPMANDPFRIVSLRPSKASHRDG